MALAPPPTLPSSPFRLHLHVSASPRHHLPVISLSSPSSSSDRRHTTTAQLAVAAAAAPPVILEMRSRGGMAAPRRPAPPAGPREGRGGVVVHAVARDAPPLPGSGPKTN
uniref:Uncharacterized protein n=1 Tax=Leersia perrieri TaxID=77586 RepID=A0A0D9X4V6_9ORYZ